MTIDEVVKDLDEFQQAVWHAVIKEGKTTGLKYFKAEYDKFPSAKDLDDERYKNFMVYKITQAYESTRKQYPNLPELGDL